MDIYNPQNRIFVTAGLAKQYHSFEFQKEYKSFLESGQEELKDKFGPAPWQRTQRSCQGAGPSERRERVTQEAS